MESVANTILMLIDFFQMSGLVVVAPTNIPWRECLLNLSLLFIIVLLFSLFSYQKVIVLIQSLLLLFLSELSVLLVLKSGVLVPCKNLLFFVLIGLLLKALLVLILVNLAF
jgi:hypothetical protein